VSTNGGTAPRFSADGTEIYFIAPDLKMMAVPVKMTETRFEAGIPAALFPTSIVALSFKHQYAVSNDGRFLVNNRQVEEASASPITVIFNRKP
jgi:hypothetical protein